MSDLQPPGAGIPPLERAFLKAILKSTSAFQSASRLVNKFMFEAQVILELVDENDYGFCSQQVIVPRFPGMEDSSRNWSLFMVLDHLCQVDQDILRVIDLLHDGVVPRGTPSIADYKPDPDCGAETIDRFRNLVHEFSGRVREMGSLRGPHRFPHPWFGPMTAQEWLALAAAHHGIHRKQARKIAAMIGQA